MSSPAPFIPARSVAARRRSLGDRLAMAMGLSAGAVGTSSLAQAGDADAPRTPHTLLLPEHYKIFEGGTAVFALESGEQLSLTSDQYVLLDGGLLLVVDELVQNTMAQLPVRGSLRTQLLTEVEPVRNQEGSIVEVSSTLPLWSGDVSQPGLFEEIDLQTYELAQNTGSDAADVASSLDDSGSLSLLAGASLLALSVGLFGLLPREDEDDGSSTGGGSDGGGTTFSGTVIKGPLVNAFVFLDENDNGLFDAGEPNFTTSSTGGFSISSSAANPKLIVTTNDQTIDTTTGTVLSGMTFKAPAGASVVSPLTTMMEETGLSASEVKSVLGLPASVNPLTFNPYGPGVNAADALATEQASAQTMATLAAFAAAAAGTGISQQDAFAAALSALSTVMQSKSSSGASLDLSDAADLAAVQSAFTTAVAAILGVTGAQTTAMAGVIGDATTAIQNVNNKIASITNTDLSDAANGNIFGLLQVLQDQVEQAAEDETATPGSGTIGFTDPTAVDNAATNSAPTDIALSAASISEDAASLVVGVLTTTDDNATDFNFTYEIAEIDGLTDHTAFTIDQTNGELKFVSQPDFETQSSYTITIKATDGGGKSFSETFTISVTDANEPPVFDPASAFSTPENQLGTGVTPMATDQNGDTLNYSIVGGADGDKFELDGTTGELKFKVAPNFEAPGSANGDNDYIIQIRADDGNGGTATQTFTITVTDANDPPVFTSSASHSVQENQSDTGYTPAATDPENDSVTFTINGGADAGKFELFDGALKFKAAPDFDNPGSADNDNVYEVQIQASDGNGGTATQSVSVTVTDLDENPIQSTDISSLKLIGAGVTNDFTFGEKLQPIGTVLGDLNGDGGDEFVLAGSQPTDTPGSFHLIAGLLNTGTLDDEIDLDAYHPRKVTVENDLGSKRFGVAFASGEGLTSVGSKDLLVYRGGNFEASNGYGTFDSRAYLFDAQDLLSKSAGTISTSLSATTYADFYNIQGAPLFGLATGDFNGDETADIHFGSHHHDSGGKSHLVTGDGFYTFGQSYDVLSLVASQGFSTDGVNDLGGGPFAGDFDADGFDDLIVNGYNHKVTGSLSASVYVVWGNDTFTPGDTYNLYSTANPKWTMIHGSGGQSLIEVSTVQSGDFIGTTTPDLVISARNIDKTYRDLYIIDGDELADRPNEINLSALATNQGVHLTGIHLTDQTPASSGEILQIHTVVLDDLDGDDKNEIGFASSKSNGTDAEVGIVYSQSINGLSAPFDFSANSNTVTTVDDDVSTTRFGTTIWRAGDVDGDGVQDYGIGFADETAGKEGAHIISGAGLVTPGSTLTVTEPNGRPVFTSGTSFNAAENQLETGYTPAATDPENDSVTFTINGGADAGKFELVGGALKFRTAPDFDTPGSADSDNVYEVQIQASDGNGGTASQTVSVTVTNVDESTANSQFQVLKIEPKSGQIGFGYSANTLGDGSHLYDIGVGALAGGTWALSKIPTFSSNAPSSIGYDKLSSNLTVEYDLATEHKFPKGINVGPNVVGSNDSELLLGLFASYSNRTDNGVNILLDIEAISQLNEKNINISELSASYIHAIPGIKNLDRSHGITSIGDFDGDNVDDLAIGLSSSDPNASISGEMFVISGAHIASQFSLSEIETEITAVASDQKFNLDGYEYRAGLGERVFAAGDINSDGYSDFFAAATYSNNSPSQAKAYFVLGGPFTQSDLVGNAIPTGRGIEIIGEGSTAPSNPNTHDASNGRFGYAFTKNSNSLADAYFAIGAQASDGQQPGSGVVYLLPQQDVVTAIVGNGSSQSIASFTNLVRLQGNEQSEGFGYSLDHALDFNSDGYSDLAVGATHSSSPTASQVGSVTVLDGEYLSQLAPGDYDPTNFPADKAVTIFGVHTGQRFGYEVGVQDFDEDGIDDLLISAPGNLTSDPGAVYLLSGQFIKDASQGTGVDTPGLIDLGVLYAQNQAPFIHSSPSISFNENGTGIVHAFTANDPDGDIIAYSLVGGADHGLFDIDSSSGVLTFKGAAPDYENPTDSDTNNVYEVQIQASDGNGGTATQSVFVTVTNIDDGEDFAVRLDGASNLDAAGGFVGRSLQGAGDFNADGREDILIGVQFMEANGLANGGKSFVLDGKWITETGQGLNPIVDLETITPPAGAQFEAVDGNQFGMSLSRAGNIDGDGLDDQLIGARGLRSGLSGPPKYGYVELIFGDYLSDIVAKTASSVNLGSYGPGDAVRLVDNKYGYFGGDVAGGHDVDGDGLDDVIIGAPSNDPQGATDAGEAYMVFGSYLHSLKSDGVISQDISALEPEQGLRLNHHSLASGEPGDFGFKVAMIPDLQGDDRAEILVGARLTSANGVHQAGQVFLLYGDYLESSQSNDSAVLDVSNIASDEGILINGAEAGDMLGQTLGSAGDVDGDQIHDLLLGGASALNVADTKAYIIYGDKLNDLRSSGQNQLELANLDAQTGLLITGFDYGYSGFAGSSGSYLAKLNDVDADGIDDLAVSSYGADIEGEENVGFIQVIFGSYLRDLKTTQVAELDIGNLPSSAGVRIEGALEGDFFGSTIAGAGDVNNDGYDDVIIGAPGADPDDIAEAGSVYLISGHTIAEAADGIGVHSAGIINVADDLGL